MARLVRAAHAGTVLVQVARTSPRGFSHLEFSLRISMLREYFWIEPVMEKRRFVLADSWRQLFILVSEWFVSTAALHVSIV
jgi:hypothetical protein